MEAFFFLTPLNSLPTTCSVISANSLDPDIMSGMLKTGSKLFDTMIVFLKEFFEKVNFDKNKSMKNYPACKEVNCLKTSGRLSHSAIQKTHYSVNLK